MQYLIPLGFALVMFLALPWLVLAFNRYCDAINRLIARRKATRRG